METNNAIKETATLAFNRQSDIFDEIYAQNITVAYKRERTRSHLERFLKIGDTLLELNAGTGQDAVYFAQKGFRVDATDISAGMLAQLRKKVAAYQLNDLITTRQLSFTELDTLSVEEPYDAIFSNFGGLNCTDNLDRVLLSFDRLVKKRGTVTLVVMPPFCLWDFLMVLKGDFKVAFRRLFAQKGAKAHIEGVHFLCWYYTPAYIIDTLKHSFDVVSLEGLCTVVPPSYLENFPKKHKTLYNFLIKWENKWKAIAPFKYIGDYFIITLQKK